MHAGDCSSQPAVSVGTRAAKHSHSLAAARDATSWKCGLALTQGPHWKGCSSVPREPRTTFVTSEIEVDLAIEAGRPGAPQSLIGARDEQRVGNVNSAAQHRRHKGAETAFGRLVQVFVAFCQPAGCLRMASGRGLTSGIHLPSPG